MSIVSKSTGPTHVVGTKFDGDGQACRFPGNTLVSFLRDGSGVAEELRWVLSSLTPRTFSDAFAPLPASSFHMTVCDLLCDQVRTAPHWSRRLPQNIPLEQADAALREWLAPLPAINSLQLRYAGVGPLHTSLHILLDPANRQTATALESFREQIAERTGIRHPNHDHYRFHISVAYLLRHLGDQEREAFDRFALLLDQRLGSTLARLELADPQLVFFEDMLAYRAERKLATTDG
jgi:hypothetical protein